MKRLFLSALFIGIAMMFVGANGCADQEARNKISELESKVAAISDIEGRIESLENRIADLETKLSELEAKKETKTTATPAKPQPKAGAPAGKVK